MKTKAIMIASEIIEKQSLEVYKQLDEILSKDHFKISSNFDVAEFKKFQLFYESKEGKLPAVKNEGFFNEFIKYYQIRGVSNQYLNSLSNSKLAIHKLLKSKKITQLYFEYFHNKNTRSNLLSNQGCFVGKLIHLMFPDEYSAIDNYQRQILHCNNNLFIIDYLTELSVNWL